MGRVAVGVNNGNWRGGLYLMYEGETIHDLIKASNQRIFADALEELKQADPEGWEAWYDDEKNVPNFNWHQSEKVAEIAKRMRARVVEIKGTAGNAA